MKTRLWFLVAIAALVASGCFKVEFTVDVNDDGSGTVSGVTAFDFETISDALDDLGEDFVAGEEEICSDAGGEFGIDESEFDSVETFNEDGFCGVRFSASFAPGEAEQALAGIDEGDGSIRRDGDGWFFELPIDSSDFDTGETPIPGIDGLLGDAEYIVRVRLPGRQVEHNGEIDGEGFVVWDVDITNPPDRLFLRTEPGETITGDASVGGDDDGGGSALTVILIVVAVLMVLGLIAWLLMRNRGGDAAAPASGIDATIRNEPPTTPPVDGSATIMAPAGDFQMPTSADLRSDPAPTTPPTEAAAPVQGAATAGAPAGGASPTPEQATGQPAWDPVRGAYVQWDPANSRWLIHDQASGTWHPE